jgi:hypothetical protein
MQNLVLRANELNEQATYLESPFRRSGPSVEEAAETIRALRKEADERLCDAFYAVPAKMADKRADTADGVREAASVPTR